MPSTAGPTTRSWPTTTRAPPCRPSLARCRCASSSQAAGRRTPSREPRRSRSSTRAAAVEEDASRAPTASSGERRAACASSTRPPTRGSSSTSRARSVWAPRRRFESTAPSASAGRTTTGTAICASSAPARRSCSSTSCRSSTTCAASCRARCRPRGWLAALRAQAVAARSYAVATRHPTSLFDAYADTRSQVYGPIEHEAAGFERRPSPATAHQVLWYSGSVAVGFFSSSSGGWTASEQAAWGSGGEPYLVPVRDRYDGAQGLNPQPQLDAACASRRAGWRARSGSAARCARST